MYTLSDDMEVLQMAWKDAQVVLFMSTIHDGHDVVQRLRRRPHTQSAQNTLVFGKDKVKWLWIPKFIDEYNHNMNGVDRAYQIREPYHI